MRHDEKPNKKKKPDLVCYYHQNAAYFNHGDAMPCGQCPLCEPTKQRHVLNERFIWNAVRGLHRNKADNMCDVWIGDKLYPPPYGGWTPANTLFPGEAKP